MPVEPIREMAMAALADRLTTIVAGPVYHTSPTVTRSLLSIDQYKGPTDLPLLGVMRSSGSTFGAVTHDTWAHAFRVTLWGYVRATAGVLAGTWLERLWQDLRTCVLGDPTLGGRVLQVELDGLPLDTDEGALEPWAWFAQDCLITMHEAAA
jgi:hypothetical protein